MRVIDGNSENNVLNGRWYDNELIRGREGNDLISGRSGSDIILGNDGNDILFGGLGINPDYYLYVVQSVDSFNESKESIIDFIETDGKDILYGGNGNDYIYGGKDSDTLYGDSDGFNFFDGFRFGDYGYGHDYLDGGEGNDVLIGGAGNDILIGGNGGNFFYPNDNDTLDGGEGNDILFSKSIYGNKDELTGGPGNDAFIINSSKPSEIDELINPLISIGETLDQTGLVSIITTVIDYLAPASGGWNDYAIITDFELGEDVLVLGGEDTDYYFQELNTNRRYGVGVFNTNDGGNGIGNTEVFLYANDAQEAENLYRNLEGSITYI